VLKRDVLPFFAGSRVATLGQDVMRSFVTPTMTISTTIKKISHFFHGLGATTFSHEAPR
jgi:hypothetical protein